MSVQIECSFCRANFGYPEMFTKICVNWILTSAYKHEASDTLSGWSVHFSPYLFDRIAIIPDRLDCFVWLNHNC